MDSQDAEKVFDEVRITVSKVINGHGEAVVQMFRHGTLVVESTPRPASYVDNQLHVSGVYELRGYRWAEPGVL
jgi:hypothetical protein